MTRSSPRDVTQLLVDWNNGDEDAPDKLMPLVYDELRRLANHYLRHERPDHTLQSTALVHEAYLRLVQIRQRNWQNRAHFFGAAAQSMRRILVDHARRHRAAIRGGSDRKLSLDEATSFTVLSTGKKENDVDLITLDEALDKLAALDP